MAVTGVFLSYARSDDEPFVRQVVERLRVAAFDVWFDRENMPSRSLTFLQEIRDAIRQRDRLLVILGPGAVKSDYVRAEWQAALVEGKAVTPLLRRGGYSLVPPELKNLHCPDAREARPFEDVLTEVLRILREPLPPLGVLAGPLPAVPPHFQPRPDDLSQLASSILYEMEHPVVLDPTERTTVLHGMGGVGKSVLASALARTTTTRRVFGDGVLWVELTTTSTPLDVVRNVLLAAAQPIAASAGLSEAVTGLRQWLESRRCLIVLDNAWAVNQIASIVQSISPASRLLVTTRDSGIATSLGALSQHVEALPLSAALVHLADWVGISIEDLPPEAQSVAEQCGGLPFALALQGALARDGVPWSYLLDALRDADLSFARQKFPDYPYFDVLNVIQASVDMLQATDLPAATRFLELSAFFWSEGVPTSALIAFWKSNSGLAPREGWRLLVELQRKELIRIGGTPPVATVHDLVADYLATRKEVDQLRTTLLNYYRAHCVDGWASGPDDGYFHRHLIDHLAAEPNGQKELKDLLSTTTDENRNAWFEASDRTGNLDAYRRQLERLINNSSTDLADIMTLVTRIASVNALAGNIPPLLAGKLVQSGIWTLKQALGYARQVPDPVHRVACLVELLEQADDEQKRQLLDESLAVVRTMEEFPENLQALPELQSLLDALAREGRTDEALALARRISNGDPKAAALAIVARHLTDADLNAVIAEAIEVCATTIDVFRAAAIASVMSLLDLNGLEKLRAAAIEPLTNPVARSWCERQIITRLLELNEVDAAWSRAQNISHQLSRTSAIADCVAVLPEQEREAVVDEVLATISAIDIQAALKEMVDAFSPLPKILEVLLPAMLENTPFLLGQLKAITPYLTNTQVATVLNFLRQSTNLVFAAEGAATLAPVISTADCEALVATLLPLVSQEENEKRRIPALAALLPATRGDQRKQLLEMAFGYVRASHPLSQPSQIEKLGPALQGDELDEALTIAAGITGTGEGGKCVESLLPAATPQQLDRARSVVMTIGDRDELLLASAALSPNLDADMQRELLDRALEQEDYIRARTIALLAPQLNDSLFEITLQAANEIKDPGFRARVALTALAQRATGDRRRQIFESAIEIAAGMKDPQSRVWAFEVMIAQFDSALVEKVFVSFTEAESGISEGWGNFETGSFLSVIAPLLPEPTRGKLLDDALALVPQLKDVFSRRALLSRLAPHLDLQRWKVAVSLVKAEEDPYERAITAGLVIGDAPESLRLKLVLAALSEIQKIEAKNHDSISGGGVEGAGARVVAYSVDPSAGLAVVRGFHDQVWKREALREYAKASSPDLWDAVLAQIKTLSAPRDRASLKLALARRFTDGRRNELVAEALDDALKADAELLHDDLLPELAESLCELPLDRLRDLWRENAPRLAERARPQMLALIHGLAPVLVKLDLGGPTARAIFDVERWWP